MYESDDKRNRNRTSYRHNSHHRHHHHNDVGNVNDSWFGWTFGFFFFFVIFVFIFWSISYYPANHHGNYTGHYHHSYAYTSADPFVFKRSIQTPSHNAKGCGDWLPNVEQWDRQLAQCTPKFPTPLPFVGELVDDTIDPCKGSFYTSMCGIWDANKHGVDRLFSYGFHNNQQKTEQAIKTAPPGTPIHALYRSCLNQNKYTTVKESEIQLVHLKNMIVEPIRTHADLAIAFGRLTKQGYTMPFGFTIEKDPFSPDEIPLIGWDGFHGLKTSGQEEM